METIDLSGQELLLAGIESPEMVLSGRGSKGALTADAGTSKYRKHFLSRFHEMPDKVKDGLLKGRLQLIEQKIYNTRDIAGEMVEIFKEDDDISTGIRNVAKSKLEQDKPMVLSAILLVFSGAAANAFAPAAYTDEFNRGEFELRYNSQDVIEKMPILGSFSPIVPGYNTHKQYGLYELDHPKTILGDKKIQARLYFPAALAGATSVKVILIGTSVKPFSRD